MGEVFSDSLPVISHSRDFEKVEVDNPKLDRDYIAGAVYENNRNRIEKQWQQFKPYADPDFLPELGRQFRRRMWEMNMGCLFLDSGFTLLPKKSADGPDLQTQNFHIECVCPARGSGDFEVPLTSTEMKPIPKDLLKLRIANALQEKEKQYSAWVENSTVSRDKPRIIAINLGDLSAWSVMGHGHDDPSIVEEALFGFGDEEVHYDAKTFEVIRVSRAQRKSVPKGQSPVDLGFFLDNQHASLSAVIGSQEMFVDPWDIEVLHNPYAANPVNQQELGMFKQVTWEKKPKGLRRRLKPPVLDK
ncbi:MAG: hypothetical protein Q8Q11_00140 [bacterium]|nr:hypothetical protein [bacterium]